MMKRFFVSVFFSVFFLSYGFAQSSELKISCCNWPPYNLEKLPNGGFYTEITVEALKKSGYKPQVTFLPWKRALEMTRNGKYDALMGASYTKERTEFFSYPEYAWENSMTLFSQKGQQIKYKKLEDLCPSRIGLLRGSFYVKRLNGVPCLTQDLATDVLMNLRKLAAGRLDLILDSKDSIYYILKTELPEYKDSIEPIFPPFEIDKIYTVFSKKNPDHKKFVSDFDKGMKAIKVDGQYEAILKKHGMY